MKYQFFILALLTIFTSLIHSMKMPENQVALLSLIDEVIHILAQPNANEKDSKFAISALCNVKETIKVLIHALEKSKRLQEFNNLLSSNSEPLKEIAGTLKNVEDLLNEKISSFNAGMNAFANKALLLIAISGIASIIIILIKNRVKNKYNDSQALNIKVSEDDIRAMQSKYA